MCVSTCGAVRASPSSISISIVFRVVHVRQDPRGGQVVGRGALGRSRPRPHAVADEQHPLPTEFASQRDLIDGFGFFIERGLSVFGARAMGEDRCGQQRDVGA